ncbi:phospholipase D-like domain-containing protein [Campylobacter canadensis]|uniref:Phospholipase D-like domain-containing protein n=1 Tax=Campylobacter canadensis TaxID=449520 RepID=A0ABS7WT76_9BACT|nr:phospholipase D-like domain-containing protein [Campylobacter canadensis]MBZ7987974.1 hypothetical protein [Campylobacter canadensis]MBZ7995421.1 hypothetical protein [Campylobacter canadensis]MBZ7997031.1 hypothetical protein [Campylobacter canadensis]MBZ7998906.1 hypothetical protein [Campylobacter canadensis]MBZ8000600.1 hypothetical protein [Campylobacter canadensis]
MKLNFNLIQHKFTYFGEDNNYELYDIKYVFYPVYKCIVNCIFKEDEQLTQIEVFILRLIDTTKSKISTIEKITCLDKDVLNTIISELIFKAYLDNNLNLSKKAKDYLNNIKSTKMVEKEFCVIFDAISADIIELSQSDIRLEHKVDKDAIELKRNNTLRPDNNCLNNIYKDDKTLKQVIFENIQNFENNETLKLYSVKDLSKISMFYKKHLCCFYKNSINEKKIVALNIASEDIVADEGISRLFDKLLEKEDFKVKENQATKDNSNRFENYTFTLDIKDGQIIDECSHKKYFKYILENAKNDIYIQSPWIRFQVLNEYLDYIKSALSRKVNIHIKYGIENKSKRDNKAIIDKKAEEVFIELKNNYANFKTYKDNSHEKFIICDNDFIINGSFNWLSYLHNEGNERKENSTITKNKDTINKKIKDFYNKEENK